MPGLKAQQHAGCCQALACSTQLAGERGTPADAWWVLLCNAALFSNLARPRQQSLTTMGAAGFCQVCSLSSTKRGTGGPKALPALC